ncbi:hypothetical protein P389DRAFT_48088 [Cystobasidium minutum MCA 4210]|uniref:uncharacterized protein n=1 Tax=Cystobasidium minutum MCA 4210 TaxID=1397322 RepID=UPI0034CFDA66|eukprot:jgi/Rhomi1/48088/CE48087_391
MRSEVGPSSSASDAAGPSTCTPGGSFEYVTAVDERLCCPICQAPMQDPWMSKTCEHFYCYECILQHLTGSDTAGTCPCDRSPLRLDLDQPNEKRQLVAAPRLVKLLCDELPVRCTSTFDCKWTGQRSHWQRHYEHECSRQSVDTCPNACGYTGRDIEKHKRESCPKQAIDCKACSQDVATSELQPHRPNCPKEKVSCPHCNIEKLPRVELEGHMTDSCPESQVSCPHAQYGCTWKGKRRLLRIDHLDVDCIFEPLKTVLDGHQNRISSLENENSTLKRELADLREKFEDLDHRVQRITHNIGYGQTRDLAGQPINQQLDSLAVQMNDMKRASTRSQLASEHTLHEVKGEMSNLQMMLHDLRGELMALQHTQYYENAYRSQWGRSGMPMTSRPNETSQGKDSEDGNADTTSQPNPSSIRPLAMPQSNTFGYPFPPYPGMLGAYGGPVTSPPYGMPPPGSMFAPRRWSGWPYGYTSSSPEERGGGVKL